MGQGTLHLGLELQAKLLIGERVSQAEGMATNKGRTDSWRTVPLHGPDAVLLGGMDLVGWEKSAGMDSWE